MKIGIDARALTNNRAGISNYVYEIVKKLNNLDKKNEYILYSNKNIVLDFNLNHNWNMHIEKSRTGTIWFYNILPKKLCEDKIDVFWGTQYFLPKRNKETSNVRLVVTIHDLAIQKIKNIGSNRNIFIQKLYLRKSLKNADKIIAISETTKKDIIDIYSVNDEKISIIFNGNNPPEKYNMVTNIEEEMRHKFKIDNNKFLLFLSTIEPRKNIDTLIRAFEYIKEKDKDLKLIIAGGLGWKYKRTLDLIEESKYAQDMILTGYVTNEEKAFLYSRAEMFIYPSLYEGFGLPILEAFGYGCLVITTNISSMPEVGGDVAIYYDNPLDYKELVQKIEEVITMTEMEKLQKIEKGRKQILKFSWDKCSKEVLDLLCAKSKD